MPRTTATERQATGFSPYSLTGNGTTGFASGASAFDKADTDAWAVSGWFFLKFGVLQAMAGKYSSPAAGWYFQYRGDSAGFAFEMYGRAAGGGSGACRLSFVAPNRTFGRWFHFVGNVSATKSGTKIYIDSVDTANTIANQNNLVGPATGGAGDFAIGKFPALGSGGINGGYARVRMHSRLLTQTEITNLFKRDEAVAVDSAWLMTEGSGSSLGDSVGAVPLTIDTPVWSSASTPRPIRATAT